MRTQRRSLRIVPNTSGIVRRVFQHRDWLLRWRAAWDIPTLTGRHLLSVGVLRWCRIRTGGSSGRQRGGPSALPRTRTHMLYKQSYP